MSSCVLLLKMCDSIVFSKYLISSTASYTVLRVQVTICAVYVCCDSANKFQYAIHVLNFL